MFQTNNTDDRESDASDENAALMKSEGEMDLDEELVLEETTPVEPTEHKATSDDSRALVKEESGLSRRETTQMSSTIDLGDSLNRQDDGHKSEILQGA